MALRSSSNGAPFSRSDCRRSPANRRLLEAARGHQGGYSLLGKRLHSAEERKYADRDRAFGLLALGVFRRSWRTVAGGVLSLTRYALMVAGGVVMVIGFVSIVLSYSAAVVTIVVGFWDLLVWLFNAEWRTSHFKASLWGLGIWIVAGFVGNVAGEILESAEPARKALDQKAGVLPKELPDEE